MSEDQFDKLFRYMQQQFREVVERFNEVDKKFDHVYETLDTILRNQETEAAERAAMITELDRHDTWIHQLADHAHLDLSQG